MQAVKIFREGSFTGEPVIPPNLNDRIWELKRSYPDDPQSFVNALNLLQVEEWRIFQEVCRLYSYEQLKNFKVIIDKNIDVLRQVHMEFEKQELFFRNPIPENVEKTDILNLPGLLLSLTHEQDVKCNDTVEWVKDNYSYYELLTLVVQSLPEPISSRLQYFINKKIKGNGTRN